MRRLNSDFGGEQMTLPRSVLVEPVGKFHRGICGPWPVSSAKLTPGVNLLPAQIDMAASGRPAYCRRTFFDMAGKLLKGSELGRNSIRAWRNHRNLTLERLADRLSELGEPITPTSLSRIERSIQPYSQRTLEALAQALNCEPADLVTRKPRSKEQLEIWSVIEGLRDEQQKRALEVLKVLVA